MNEAFRENDFVFLAHSKKDRQFVSKLNRRLKSADFETWFDEEHLISGQQWMKEIPRLIRVAKYFIAVISKNFVQSEGFVQKEFRLALEEMAKKRPDEIYFIPVLLDETQIPQIRVGNLWLSDFHALRVDSDQGLNRLIKDIIYLNNAQPIRKNITWLLKELTIAKRHIASGDIEAGIYRLEPILNLKNSSKYRNDFILLSSRWARTNKTYTNGFFTSDEYLRNINQVTKALLDHIKIIEEESAMTSGIDKPID